MRSLTRARRSPLRDPAPSKWGYRYQRWMLTPGVRTGVRVGVPLALIATIATVWITNPANRAMLDARIAEAKAAVQNRPEFQVARLDVVGGDPTLAAAVTQAAAVQLPASSFDLDLPGLRARVAALDAVRDARVRLGEAGTLLIEITPRVPAALWREGQQLKLIDADGVFAGTVAARSDRLDLPLIAGDGAQAHIAEALELFAATGPIAPRVRGLVRMGERRWDMVLDRDQRILLPESDPRIALDRVIALAATNDLLARDVAVVDMRNSHRPTVRMNQDAASAMRRVSETVANN